LVKEYKTYILFEDTKSIFNVKLQLKLTVGLELLQFLSFIKHE